MNLKIVLGEINAYSDKLHLGRSPFFVALWRPRLGTMMPLSEAVHTIKDEEIDALERGDQARQTAFAARLGEIGEQAGCSLVEDGEAVAASFVAERTGKPGLAGAGVRRPSLGSAEEAITTSDGG
ncbi:hypothetical protein ABIF74_008940 [Bradyrhizobium japonicum]